MNIVPRKIGFKTLRVFPESQALNKWFDRPACTKPALPMKGALDIYTGINPLEYTAEGAIGYVKAPGNDVLNTHGTFCVSGANGNGHGYAINENNFVRAFVTWAIRLIIKPSWTNDRDQFCQPNCELPEDFITDCAVWCLFHNSNQTSSLKDVEYKGTIYQVRNQFYPYSVSELKEWDHPTDLNGQLRNAQDTYVATWLKGRTLSPEAQTLLNAGRKVYQVFYKEYRNLNHRKFKIDYWDVGFYQIRNALLDAQVGLVELNALKEAHTKLTEKLRPKVYEYGFLDEEIIYG